MAEVIHKHVRMNDYVGAGIYATLTWPGPCTREGGSHVLGLLGPSCVVCHVKPKVDYEPPLGADLAEHARTVADNEAWHDEMIEPEGGE